MVEGKKTNEVICFDRHPVTGEIYNVIRWGVNPLRTDKRTGFVGQRIKRRAYTERLFQLLMRKWEKDDGDTRIPNPEGADLPGDSGANDGNLPGEKPGLRQQL